MKTNMNFILSLLCLLSVSGLGFFLKLDVTAAIIGVLTVFIGGRSLVNIGNVVAASRDPNADTQRAIDSLKEKV